MNKAKNVIKKISVKKRKELMGDILLKRMFPIYELCKVFKKDIEAKNFMIAEQKEDTKKILEIIKRETYGI